METLAAVSSRHLKDQQRVKLRNLRQFCNVFDNGERRKGRTKVVQHKIDTRYITVKVASKK